MGIHAISSDGASIECLRKLDEAIELLSFMKQLINEPSKTDDTPLAFLEASQDLRQMVDTAVHIALRPSLGG